MKKLLFIVVLMCVMVLYCSTAFGAVITREDLRGDSDFIDKIMELQSDKNDVVVSNAVYVATDGSDSNTGTIDKPYATVYYAISKAKAGTVIYVRGGSYNQNIVITKSGTKDNYIQIKNYPNEKPIFDHTNYSTDGGAMIDFSNANYVHIEGLTLCHKNLVSHSGYGIKMNKGKYIILKNIEIYDINVPDPTSSKVGANAIILYANDASNPISNILIDSCYIHDCQTGWNEGVSVNGNSEYVNVINSRIENIGNIGLDFAGHFNACKDSSLDQARYCTAVGNVVKGCVSPNATSYGLYNDGGRNNTFDRNIVTECSGGIEIGSEEGGAYADYPVKGVVVKNNLVYNNIQAGISVGGYDNSATGIVCDTKVYNNTLVNNGNDNDGKELGVNKVNGLDVRNNIFYKSSTSATKELIKIRFDETLASNITFGGNCYYSPYAKDKFKVSRYGVTTVGFDNWKTLSGETGIYADPIFTDNYNIDKNSPCVNAGDNTVDVGFYDLLNNYRNVDNIDIGCYEYQTGEVPTTESTTKITTESTTETTTVTTTESTTQTTTESTTETTTGNVASSWNFSDSNWSDKTTAKTVYTVNGLTVKHNGYTGSSINGFKFEKNTETIATNGYHIQLSAKKGDKIKVYVKINKGSSQNAVLALASLKEGKTEKITTSSVATSKTANVYVSFDIDSDGDYVIYTDNTSSASVFYTSVAVENSVLMGDVNLDGVVDANDAALVLKQCINSSTLTSDDSLYRGDIDLSGSIDLKDVIKILNIINK